MLKRIFRHFDNVVLAIMVWMCTLPLVGLFLFPFFDDLKIILLVAIGWLFAALVTCWGICSWKIYES